MTKTSTDETAIPRTAVYRQFASITTMMITWKLSHEGLEQFSEGTLNDPRHVHVTTTTNTNQFQSSSELF